MPEHLAQLAAVLGMPAVALTDRDGLYGAARFVSEAPTPRSSCWRRTTGATRTSAG